MRESRRSRCWPIQARPSSASATRSGIGISRGAIERGQEGGDRLGLVAAGEQRAGEQEPGLDGVAPQPGAVGEDDDVGGKPGRTRLVTRSRSISRASWASTGIRTAHGRVSRSTSGGVNEEASRLSGGTATCLLALVVMGADAEATSYKVTTTADHAPGKCTKGDCTLREATIRANAHDGSDRVRLPGSDRPYRLTRPGADEDAGRKGDLDLGDSMLIQGKSMSRTVIVQRTDDRVFHVDSSAIFGSSAERLTIKGGLVEDGSGGGVLAEGEFFLGKTRIVGNEARNGGGAAAVGGDGRLNVVESTVSGNRAGASRWRRLRVGDERGRHRDLQEPR